MLYLIFIGLVVLGVVLLLVTVWGGIVVLLAAAAALAFVVLSRRGAPIGTHTRQARIEPTGRPRASHGGADTANRRVGQD